MFSSAERVSLTLHNQNLDVASIISSSSQLFCLFSIKTEKNDLFKLYRKCEKYAKTAKCMAKILQSESMMVGHPAKRAEKKKNCLRALLLETSLKFR